MMIVRINLSSKTVNWKKTNVKKDLLAKTNLVELLTTFISHTCVVLIHMMTLISPALNDTEGSNL